MTEITRRTFTKGAALAPLAFAPFSLVAQTAPSDKFDIVVAGAGTQQSCFRGLPG